MPDRARLPNRRPCVTERIVVGQSVYEASIGFDGEGEPKEIFLSGAKVGTDMAAILADTSVAVSVALQHGVLAEAMALSVSRVPEALDGPPERPASVIGAALDVVARYEREMAQ
jgi:hypothetical protein